MTRIGTQAPPAHALSAVEVMQRLDVDASEGLSTQEAARRLERDGPNKLAEAKREPRWRAFLRQFQDLLIIILLAAAVISFVVTREWETPVVIALVVPSTRRSGSSRSPNRGLPRDAEEDAGDHGDGPSGRPHGQPGRRRAGGRERGRADGDRVLADGRLVSASGLEVQESSLTGEAQPVGKSATDEVAPDAALGDRSTAVFMNTTVTAATPSSWWPPQHGHRDRPDRGPAEGRAGAHAAAQIAASAEPWR